MSDPDSTHRAQLAVVGLGNMGSAVLEGALDAGIMDSGDVLVCDPNQDRLDHFTHMGCKETTIEGIDRARAILVAVKPQIFPDIAPALKAHQDSTIITLMAGISTTRIQELVGDRVRVVRTMPNTPALVGSGATAICSNAAATASDLEFAFRLFESIGTVIEVEETSMHVVTATSGSGPAWVFRLAEAWITAAEAEGLPGDTAKRLVLDTLIGSANLIKESGRDVADLRRSVTSKGGTTAAGLDALDRAGFDDAVGGAIAAATRRGRELERRD